MSRHKTLTLKPVTSVSPEKIARSESMGFRFIDRKGRYILQARTVVYYGQLQGQNSPCDHTWIDVPLVPEVYA